MARVGLWYQVVAWEWGSLGVFDVLLGYGILLLAASPFPYVFSARLSAVLLGAGLMSLGVGIVGLWWRRSRTRVS